MRNDATSASPRTCVHGGGDGAPVPRAIGKRTVRALREEGGHRDACGASSGYFSWATETPAGKVPAGVWFNSDRLGMRSRHPGHSSAGLPARRERTALGEKRGPGRVARAAADFRIAVLLLLHRLRVDGSFRVGALGH